MARAHVSQESQVDETTEILVKYSIELVSYFLLNPITIRSRNLLLPLDNPSSSEITTNQSSPFPRSSAKPDPWRKVTHRRKQ